MTTTGTKRRKLAHHSSDDESQPTSSGRKAQKDFFRHASNWNLEQDYETRARKGKKHAKESNKLPQIKTSDGRIEVLQVPRNEDDAASIESDADWLEGREEEEMESETDEIEAAEVVPAIPEPQQILEAQEELAKLAMAVNEDPEANVASLKAMAEFGKSKVATIRMLALMTQMTVYKDIIPGYRIRPQSEEPKNEKISKEVRQLRQFEQALVSGYRGYIKELALCAKSETTRMRNGKSLSNIAVTCACALMTSVPHFNYRSDLLKILVGKLSRRRVDEDSAECLKALETLFCDDEEGRPTLEAVSLLAKMMRARDFEVDESVVNLFLRLRLLTEFVGKASQDRVERPSENAPKPQKREFRNKRERKAMKAQKALEKDMAQADALVSHEERDRMQSDTLKLVFATYFRILKQRSPHLMGAVLEGLAKYAHLINQDFFGDLLEALKDLIRHSDEDAEADPAEAGEEEEDEDGLPSRNLTREGLLCTVTAFALLAGQDAHNSRNELHLDLSYFTTHLFKSILLLATAADLENTTLTPSSSSSTSKINVQTTTVLLLRSLTGVLLPAFNARQVPPLRLAAFCKQLMTTTLHLPEKSAQAVLVLLGDVAHAHAKKVSSLWHTEERKGDGNFNPLSDSVEGSNPFASTVWEGELLRKHFSPKVRQGTRMLEKDMSG
ncbi:hypothetical protein DCS_07791 [Drechmeria coniospora]|uniref:Nucleolar complex-associated protein 3 n=1 Tax=Drechmeria coniospora TaxID=98403 RepID=A0A151GFF2_DRECN|nr:hypothetical protein DCS_07791 [Drechmeria coniospora]KYK55827.1 hypothetical protein DCS_07791 [Drechmeria coniospora]ODA81585.1 hypothetical protein RJ55_00085 [Drechmeria coniospora]